MRRNQPLSIVRKMARNTLFAVLGAMVITGCASGPKEYPISGTADPIINRDISGKPLSIVVRLYQLKDKNEFNRLTFDTAASGKSDTELFGSEFVARTELQLIPGATQNVTDQLQPEAKYLGVIGFFRKPDAQNWRFLVDADAVRSKGLAFVVQDCYLRLVKPQALLIPGQGADYKPECMPFSTGKPKR
ncbi:type VI secretion system lipoprotein TssJ [Chitiniphilus purpureus]|uniref:Type VI secretion system lipoprotein TssJ n=1 Tax=Chitiniphilus purpureus TaxID=2981137 RepID=A0ABY6DLJ5_9NEIS|nr:type VI secretion system lipoprotein TssJ [Chitiniphilus sp. CD1]UXY14573.1 type VI secretion system lipoprotein TssJ [Chitiniphilus sp. CD1]